MQTVTPTEFTAYVASRGYRTEPMFNSIAAGDGAPLEVTGYELRGPRGNKTVVIKEKDGRLSLFSAQLWCDSVDYATSKLRRR